MQEADILVQLTSIVKKYMPEPELVNNLRADSDFLQDLKINSAHLVDIILDIEDAFDVEISDDDAEKMLNVSSTVQIIQSKLSLDRH